MPEREGVTSLSYYDDPEALELARKASEQMGDFEFMTEMQSRLPPESRFGGKYGLISGIGYSGDYPQTGEHAPIYSFGEHGGAEGSYLGKGPRGKNEAVLLGAYDPKGDTEWREINKSMLEAIYNMTPPMEGRKPGGSYYYANPDVIGDRLERPDTVWAGGPHPKELAPTIIADSISHELFHRSSIDVLPLSDLKEYAKEKAEEVGAKWPRTRRNYRRAAKVFKELRWVGNPRYGQHMYLEAVQKFDMAGGDFEALDSDDQKKLSDLENASGVLREFFTPDRQEEYGIRLVTPEAKPEEEKGIGSLFQDLFD